MHRTISVLVSVGALCAPTASFSSAGPLTPPVGPVAPTHKTLTEIEPRTAINATNTPGDADSLYKITQPGSYYLTGKVTGVVGKHGIEITSSGVTLDLNGFDLAGVPAMGAFDAVSVTVDSLRNIAVINGTVRNWGDGGVDLGFLSFGCRVERVVASGNTGTGITAAIACTLVNCSASFNGQRGIRASNGSSISGSSAYSNAGSGIEVNHGCTISACSTYFNSAGDILAGVGCTLSNCSAYQNTGNGIQLGDAGAATGCSTLSNTGRGIFGGLNCALDGCTASFNADAGVTTDSGAAIMNCAASNNQSAGFGAGIGSSLTNCTAINNDGNGIFAQSGSTFLNCAVSQCTGNGISAGGGCTVANCSVRLNRLNGIWCTTDSVIRGNTCDTNGLDTGSGAGIFIFSGNNRIEDNNCLRADRGIEADTAGNIIIRNVCSGNMTNWVIAANNICGPILDRTAPASAAINGNSAPGSLGSTDPNANFTY